MKRTFTLIELMIVVAIIAIIAAIAIPNLLESRMQANETNAIGAMKQIANAQNIYKKANYGLTNGQAARTYAASWANLGGTAAHVNGAGTALTLIPPVLGNAAAGATAYQGYQFSDGTGATEFTFEHFSFPAVYATSGVNSYVIDEQAIVCQKDPGTGGAPLGPGDYMRGATDWVIP